MTAQELRYFRVKCDESGCKQYINVAAADDTEDLERVLSLQTIRGADGRQRSWTKPSRLSARVFCPTHAEDHQ